MFDSMLSCCQNRKGKFGGGSDYIIRRFLQTFSQVVKKYENEINLHREARHGW